MMRFYGPNGTERVTCIKDSIKNLVYSALSPGHLRVFDWANRGEMRLSPEEYRAFQESNNYRDNDLLSQCDKAYLSSGMPETDYTVLKTKFIPESNGLFDRIKEDQRLLLDI